MTSRGIRGAANAAFFVSALLALGIDDTRLYETRPSAPAPSRGYVIAVAEKKYGLGEVKTVYISQQDNALRLGLVGLLIAGVIVGGLLSFKRQK